MLWRTFNHNINGALETLPSVGMQVRFVLSFHHGNFTL